MEPSIVIRKEQKQDIDAIHHVVSASFKEETEACLVEALRESGDAAISLVAQDQDTIVGHILFSKMRAPFNALGLAPVCVLPAYQGKGIGSSLIREGLACAKENKWNAVFVLGEPAYYKRFGFSQDLGASFDTPYAGPYFMALELQDGILKRKKGVASYASAFDSL